MANENSVATSRCTPAVQGRNASAFIGRPRARQLTATAALVLLAACGQKGALVLPGQADTAPRPPSSAQATPAAAASAAPSPAPVTNRP